MPKLLIDIKLDPIPGWGNKIEDFVEHFKRSSCGIPHYIKDITVVDDADLPTDWVKVAKDYIKEHGSMSAAEVRELNKDVKFSFEDSEEDEPQVGADGPCYANTPYCGCPLSVRRSSTYLGERCATCNGLL